MLKFVIVACLCAAVLVESQAPEDTKQQDTVTLPPGLPPPKLVYSRVARQVNGAGLPRYQGGFGGVPGRSGAAPEENTGTPILGKPGTFGQNFNGEVSLEVPFSNPRNGGSLGTSLNVGASFGLPIPGITKRAAQVPTLPPMPPMP